MAWFARGLDGVNGGVLNPPEADGLPTLVASLGKGGNMRVFDHPDCEEVIPLTDFSSGQWEVLKSDWDQIGLTLRHKEAIASYEQRRREST